MVVLHAVLSGKCVLLLIGGAHVAGQRLLIKMADNSISACMEQRVVMKFLVNEGVKPADIYRRLQAQYGDEMLSRSKTFEWCKRFKDGRTSVSDDPGRGGSKPTAVIPVNIQRVERLILDNRRITCREIAQETNLSVGTVNTIIHKHLQKLAHTGYQDSFPLLAGTEELKERFDTEGQDFLDRFITCDETWEHHFTPESKRATKQWKHADSPPPKKNFEQLRLQVK